MGSTTKCYIELPQGFFNEFNSLFMVLLTHYKILIRYETDTECIISLRQSTSTHIFYHIHEWRQWRWLIQVSIPIQLLLKWFMKSLLSPIARDVVMGVVLTEYHVIISAQYLDFVLLSHIVVKGNRLPMFTACARRVKVEHSEQFNIDSNRASEQVQFSAGEIPCEI